MSDRAANATYPTSRTCTAVGVGVVAAGAAAFLLDGGAGILADMATALAGMSTAEASVAGGVLGVVCIGILCTLYGKAVLAVIVVMVVAAWTAGAACLLGVAAVGWASIAGITMSESLPAIGSPMRGAGLLASALGLVALAYCLTPLCLTDGDGGQTEGRDGGASPDTGDAGTDGVGKEARSAPTSTCDKWSAATLVFIVVILIPGWNGFSASEARAIPQDTPEPLSSAEFGKVLGARPHATAGPASADRD